ncbi:thioredoxin family protein [Cohnella sp. GCM10027633]|uniref:thioredoxin family protein n=1 Tax=unclassified Cohnella TaxID=2636738 RepID=UPI0036455C3C
MLAVNNGTFRESVRPAGLTLVDFGAEWCPPCKVLKPIVAELDEAYGDRLTVLMIDTDESPELAGEFGVMSNPTVILFQDGEPVEKLVGLRPKAVYETMLARYL